MKNKKMNKGMALIMLISLFMTILSGCKNVSKNNEDIFKKSYSWINNNEFLVTDKVDFSKKYFNNMTKPEVGSVFANYQFYDSRLNKDYFLPALTLNPQAQMLKLYLNSNKYSDKVKLIADNMVNNLEVGKLGNREFYYIVPVKYYNDNTAKWESNINTINTEAQLSAVYSLLLTYEDTNDTKYLTTALSILDSQVDNSKNGILPFEYIKNNDGIYEKDSVYSYFLIKSIYQSCEKAYEITKNEKYKSFYENNFEWVKNHINTNEISYGGVKIYKDNNEVSVNKRDDMWGEDYLFSTEDFLKTVVGISYIDKNYAKKFESIVNKLNYSDLTNDQNVLSYLKQNGSNFNSLEKSFKNSFNMLSSVLRLEYYIRTDYDQEYIDKVFSSINDKVEYKLNDTKNVSGGLCYTPSNCRLNASVTTYYLDLIYKYLVK